MATTQVIDTQPDTHSGAHPPAATCPKGHDWGSRKAYSREAVTPVTHIYRCMYGGQIGGRYVRCPGTVTVKVGPARRGFLRPGASIGKPNSTKLAVMRAIRDHGERGALFREVVSRSGLNQYQVRGCLDRLVKAKAACIERTETPLLPHGVGYIHKLSQWGTWVLEFYERHEL